MATLNENIQRIENAKLAIKNSIEAKGVTVGDGLIDTYAAKIDEIPAGGTCNLIPLEVTQNGTFVPDMGVDGYSDVTVNVPTGGGSSIDWEGTGYTPSVSNQLEMDWTAQQQVNVDYTKQKAAEWDPSNTSTQDLYNEEYGGHYLVYAPKINTINVINTSQMYYYCNFLEYVPAGLNFEKVENAQSMFGGCYNLRKIDSDLNMPLLKNASSMFWGCNDLEEIPAGFKPQNLTRASHLYAGCLKITSVPTIDTSKITALYYMFSGCKKLLEIPPMDTSSVTGINAEGLFSECTLIKIIPPIDTSKMTSVNRFLYKCTNLTSLPKLDFSSVTNIEEFFGDSWGSEIATLTDLGGFTGLKIDWRDECGLNKCPNLTKQSVLNVINELADVKALGETHTIKFHANSLALLSDEEKLIATNKGWNLVS